MMTEVKRMRPETGLARIGSAERPHNSGRDWYDEPPPVLATDLIQQERCIMRLVTILEGTPAWCAAPTPINALRGGDKMYHLTTEPRPGGLLRGTG